MGCGERCMLISFYIITFGFMVLGAALLGLGIYIRTNGNGLDIVVDTSWHTAAYLMIAIGVMVFLISLLGCLGAVRKSTCLLGTYLSCMIAIFIVELAGAIYAGINRTAVESTIRNKFSTEVKDSYGQPQKNAITTGIDQIQTLFQCCGIDSPFNWTNSKWSNSKPVGNYGPPVPDSCCKMEMPNCGTNPANHYNETIFTEAIYQQGCYIKIRDLISNNIAIAIAILATFGCLQLKGLAYRSGV
ncbi:Tetraspanin-11 [Trichoplax sp. H2]|nr:Tetraspanin-11 [Trichoplax sp. H2]|eukprot:RDD39597.1 Tetraspanin-11 [Trichoplax sp. H2]